MNIIGKEGIHMNIFGAAQELTTLILIVIPVGALWVHMMIEDGEL